MAWFGCKAAVPGASAAPPTEEIQEETAASDQTEDSVPDEALPPVSNESVKVKEAQVRVTLGEKVAPYVQTTRKHVSSALDKVTISGKKAVSIATPRLQVSRYLH